jgi:hypothetical protein
MQGVQRYSGRRFRTVSVREHLRETRRAKPPQTFPVSGFRIVEPILTPCSRVHDPTKGLWSGSIVDASGDGSFISYVH